MKVLVTGGTGFVGSHATAALVGAGHQVRLLVRRVDQIRASLGPLGVVADDVVVGDATDGVDVERALDGCAAVVHAAAVYSLDPRRADEMTQTNARAAELVLGGAAERGLDPIVHVSTIVVLARFGGTTPELPLGDIDRPYARSKIESERIARRLQEEGAPVVIVYPGAVGGPNDPYRGDQSERLRWVLRGRLPVWPAGGVHMVDVRDTAATIAAALESGRRPGRYVVPGHHVDASLLYGTLAKITGRRYPYLVLPARIARPATRSFDSAQRRFPARWHVPVESEGTEILARDTHFDTTPAREDLGIKARSFEESLRDTVQWLVDSGRVPARYGVSEAVTPDPGRPTPGSAE